MRLVTFVPPGERPRAGALLGPVVVDLAAAAPLVFEEAETLRWDMLSILCHDQEEVSLEGAAEVLAAVTSMVSGALPDAPSGGNGSHNPGMPGSLSIGGVEMLFPLDQVRLLAPLPRPASLRDFYTFEQHVSTAMANRGREVPAEWYRFPAFYFSNHGAIYGPDEPVPMPQTESLDFELELACVIGREGRDIYEDEAAEYIAGYMIMNDWSARDVQGREISIGLGPAKAKDFATSLGPWLVTADELEIYADDDGRLSLEMVARVNSVERSRGNAASMYYTFSQMIAHASRDTTLYPGDVLGSGTVGTGCLLELTAGYGPWLERGDVVEMEITGLGLLRNQVV